MPIIITGILLVIFGLLAIFSVSIHESFTLALKGIAQWRRQGDPSNYFYFNRQIRNLVIGVVMAIFTYYMPTKRLQNKGFVAIVFGLIVLLQLAVFIPGIGLVLNGARWWINLWWLTTIQPAEFFKLWYVLFLGSWLMRKSSQINTPWFYWKFIILNAICLSIFLLIPDLGTALILWIVGLIMYRYAGASFKLIASIAWAGIGIGLSAGLFLSVISPKFDYIKDRFTYFLSSDVDPQSRQIWRQNEQALIAIGWWWFRWQWYGKWLQKFGYIPEAQSDFIFAAFSEEIGFLGNGVLLALYFYLCRYTLTHLSYSREQYSKLMGVGIISLIIIQMFVNIGVNLKILPNTWLTLPFISYGGTAIMVNLIEIVILYKIVKKNSFVS
jgi:cell division protein FtsW